MPLITTTQGRQFSATEGESLLDAALRADVALSYSCRTGRCSSCKGKIREGETRLLHEETGLSPAEREEGWVLTCSRQAVSEVLLEVEDLGVPLIPARTLPCRIQSLERLSADVLRVELRLPPNSRFNYRAGQYIDVIGPGGVRRSYSVANAPVEGRPLELHIRQVPGGAMSQYWFEQARPNDLLRLHGPLGTFFLRDVADRDLVFLATGTGLAPVKAMLESLSEADAPRPRSVTVYWGGRVPADLYWESSALAVPHRFVPVLSRADADWHGRRGHVQAVMLADSTALDQSVVYACGSDLMIRDAHAQLVAAGLPEQRFHSDAFVCSSAA
ncbi:MAG: hypothetical protein RLZZ592_3027 [Pseudomonadota bacterium]|jgi:CDP-4-dehydro-6-deoxyglucose reductase